MLLLTALLFLHEKQLFLLNIWEYYYDITHNELYRNNINYKTYC